MLCFACSGTIEGNEPPEKDATLGGAQPGVGAGHVSGADFNCVAPSLGPSPLRRLTHLEYDNAIRDLIGASAGSGARFPKDNQIGFFDNTASTQTISPLLAEQYLSAAVSLAQGIVDPDAFAGCSLEADSACFEAFVSRFGRRVYRRPLGPEELDGYRTLFDAARAEAGSAVVQQAVVAAFLSSPHFLFRPEFGVGSPSDSAKAKAGPYEIGARLASLLWASIPDTALLDAAASGALDTEAGVSAEAMRLIDDPRARQASLEFYVQWFGLGRLETTNKNAEHFPEFDDSLRTAMGQETRRFVDHVVWEDDARVATLLSAPYSFVNSELGAIYGMAPLGGGSEFSRVELPTNERLGLITQPGILSALAAPSETSPFKRGAWVRERLLCHELPAPPNEVPALPEPQAGVSNRERARQHSSSPACSGCHGLIDGIGFGLEQYDAIGRVQTLDRGVPVDTSGELTQTLDVDGPFEGGPELATRLASSEQVSDCAAEQWFRFALGRPVATADACDLATLQARFREAGGDLRQVLLLLTQTDAFLNYGGPEG
jgi:hypothetical protein